MKSKITKEQQIKELIERVPPVLNVNIIIAEKDKYIIGRRAKAPYKGYWLFPGSRMHYDEAPQETASRVLKVELPGINASLKKLITATGGSQEDPRANGVNLYYLFEFKKGKPLANDHLDEFKWVSKEELLKEKHVFWITKTIVNEIDVTIRTMNTTQDEVLVEVDKKDKEIGTIIKREAHSNPKRFHRAAHIMVFDSNGGVVLQKRSWNKAICPGAWDMAGGHQVAGQTIEQTAMAELTEEIGINPKLTMAGKALTFFKQEAEYAYLFWGISDGPYGFDKNEVEAIKVFDPVKIIEGKYGKEFEILPHVIKYTKELKEVWEPSRKKH